MIGIDGKWMRLPESCGQCFARGEQGCRICHVTLTDKELFGKPTWCPLCEMMEMDVTYKESHVNYKAVKAWVIA